MLRGLKTRGTCHIKMKYGVVIARLDAARSPLLGAGLVLQHWQCTSSVGGAEYLVGSVGVICMERK